MSRSRFREIEELMRECEAAGCRTVLTKNLHWKVYAPLGVVTCASTASDYRAIKNARSQLKRYGVRI